MGGQAPVPQLASLAGASHTVSPCADTAARGPPRSTLSTQALLPTGLSSRVPASPGLTRPEDGQGAVLVQPGQRRPVQLLQAAGGHHPLEGLKQRLDDDTELHSMWVKEKVSEEEGRRTCNQGWENQVQLLAGP